jgi:hypothetical protein
MSQYHFHCMFAAAAGADTGRRATANPILIVFPLATQASG